MKVFTSNRRCKSYIRDSTHGSNLNSIFLIIRELEFFLLTRFLTQNFNTMDLVKSLEKNHKLHISIITVILKVTSYRTMSKKKSKKKVKNQDSMDETNFFFGTLPFSPWAVLATWLHVGALHKIQEK
jgi:hypothetical protein